MLVLKAVVRVVGIAWVAAIGIAVWQYGPQLSPAPAPAAKAPALQPSATASVPTEATGTRVVYQGPAAGNAAPARPVPAARPAPEPEAPVAARAEPVVPAPAVAAATPAQPPARAAPEADGRIDLNTASLAELNALPGVGMVGRAIIGGRPYASPDDLVAKRILNRATFARIKEQVAVR